MQRAVGMVLLACGFISPLQFGERYWREKRSRHSLKMMFPIVFLIFAATFTIRAYRNRVRLSDAAIELRTIRSNGFTIR
jgi:hypothetical protein